MRVYRREARNPGSSALPFSCTSLVQKTNRRSWSGLALVGKDGFRARNVTNLKALSNAPLRLRQVFSDLLPHGASATGSESVLFSHRVAPSCTEMRGPARSWALRVRVTRGLPDVVSVGVVKGSVVLTVLVAPVARLVECVFPRLQSRNGCLESSWSVPKYSLNLSPSRMCCASRGCQSFLSLLRVLAAAEVQLEALLSLRVSSHHQLDPMRELLLMNSNGQPRKRSFSKKRCRSPRSLCCRWTAVRSAGPSLALDLPSRSCLSPGGQRLRLIPIGIPTDESLTCAPSPYGQREWRNACIHRALLGFLPGPALVNLYLRLPLHFQSLPRSQFRLAGGS